jgi:ABC-type nitrate/sulfonate/bicarbonate transport system ATPase subunit
MFQDSSLLPHLTVEENIHLPLKLIRETSHCDGIVNEYLEKTGLDSHRNKLPSQLSGGMKTRTALARTFITKPNLLFLDEPFSSLDIVWKNNLYEEVRDLTRLTDTTIVLVTHDIFEAIYFSNIIIVLGDTHRALETVTIEKWSDQESYNDIITKHHKDFIYIKQLIANNKAMDGL